METQEKEYWEESQIVQATEYVPQIKDYLIWMLIPTLLGLITCGIGSIILIIVWACDTKNMARANFFRAQLIVTAISIVVGIILTVLFSSLFIALINNFYYSL